VITSISSIVSIEHTALPYLAHLNCPADDLDAWHPSMMTVGRRGTRGRSSAIRRALLASSFSSNEATGTSTGVGLSPAMTPKHSMTHLEDYFDDFVEITGKSDSDSSVNSRSSGSIRGVKASGSKTDTTGLRSQLSTAAVSDDDAESGPGTEIPGPHQKASESFLRIQSVFYAKRNVEVR
jgi:hypothetical protein